MQTKKQYFQITTTPQNSGKTAKNRIFTIEKRQNQTKNTWKKGKNYIYLP